MRILISPCAYKGSLSATELADAIKSGILSLIPDAVCIMKPLADGGDGTLEAVNHSCGGKLHSVEVPGPTGEVVLASWLEIEAEELPETYRPASGGPLAVVELASASGIAHLTAEQYDPLGASTRGTGQLIGTCLEQGFRSIVITVGGSASTDGGSGILQELGARFYDKSGRSITANGGALDRMALVDLDGLIDTDACLTIATDVKNRLLGDSGAARIYAPQKGASQAQVELLENGLSSFADLLEAATGKQARNLVGAGAAGGVPFGLVCALDAVIVPGFSWLSGLIDLEPQVEESDLVIIAEGTLDSQSTAGKATGEIAALAGKHDRPVVAVPARLQPGLDYRSLGIQQVVQAADPDRQATLKSVERATREAMQLVLEGP